MNAGTAHMLTPGVNLALKSEYISSSAFLNGPALLTMPNDVMLDHVITACTGVRLMFLGQLQSGKSECSIYCG